MSDGPGKAPAPAAEQPRASRARAALSAALVLLLVLLALTAAYLAYRSKHPTERPFSPTAGPVLPSERERARAVAAAEQFALRMDAIDSEDFDGYVAGIRELLTTKAQAEFEQSGEAFNPAYESAGLTGEGEVVASAVAAQGDGTATVLVAHDSRVSSKQGDVENFWRWSVSVVEVDGTWLVDGFERVM